MILLRLRYEYHSIQLSGEIAEGETTTKEGMLVFPADTLTSGAYILILQLLVPSQTSFKEIHSR